MRFANCAALIAVLFTTLTKNLRSCSFAEAGLFLNFEQKLAWCSYKIVLIKSVIAKMLHLIQRCTIMNKFRRF